MHSNHLKKSLLALAVGQLISHGAQAAHILVDNAGDDGEGCTFREAVISITNAALEPGCRQAASAFGTRDRILFSVPSVTLKSEVVIEKDLAINPFTQDPPVTINGDGSDRLLSIRNSTVSINKTTLSGGRTRGYGGGLFVSNGATLSLTNSTVSGNQAGDGGGGIFVGNAATLSLTESTVSDNQANDDGGGLFVGNGATLSLTESTVSGNQAEDNGGGFYIRVNVGSTMVNSTVSNNVALTGRGGGIALYNCDTLIANSTISNNISAQRGGGIYALAGGQCPATLVNSTITQNVSTNATGGGIDATGIDFFLYNNLIVGNQSRNAAYNEAVIVNQSVTNSAVRQNVIGSGYFHSSKFGYAPLTLSDNNIIVDANTAANTLAPLADNGGPTLTHALPAGSPAINAGDSEVCAAEPINNLDQRGEPRDEQCDIGAVEFFEPAPEPDGTFFVVPTKNGKSVIVEL